MRLFYRNIIPIQLIIAGLLELDWLTADSGLSRRYLRFGAFFGYSLAILLLTGLKFHHGVPEISFVNYVVAFKNRIGFPSADPHNDVTIHARPMQVPCASSPKIMHLEIRYKSGNTGIAPRGPRFAHWLPIVATADGIITAFPRSTL